MKKKEMLKEQKKLKAFRNEKFIDLNDKSDLKKIAFITIGVLLFIAVVFVLINFFKGTWNLFSRENEDISFNPNLVICGTLFNRDIDEYLVLAYNVNEKEDTVYSAMFDGYKGSLPFYYLDLKSGFNKSCVSEISNLVSDSTKIKFSTQTLLHIKDGKIIKSYTSKEQIKDYLTSAK